MGIIDYLNAHYWQRWNCSQITDKANVTTPVQLPMYLTPQVKACLRGTIDFIDLSQFSDIINNAIREFTPTQNGMAISTDIPLDKPMTTQNEMAISTDTPLPKPTTTKFELKLSDKQDITVSIWGTGLVARIIYLNKTPLYAVIDTDPVIASYPDTVWWNIRMRNWHYMTCALYRVPLSPNNPQKSLWKWLLGTAPFDVEVVFGKLPGGNISVGQSFTPPPIAGCRGGVLHIFRSSSQLALLGRTRQLLEAEQSNRPTTVSSLFTLRQELVTLYNARRLMYKVHTTVPLDQQRVTGQHIINITTRLESQSQHYINTWDAVVSHLRFPLSFLLPPLLRVFLGQRPKTVEALTVDTFTFNTPYKSDHRPVTDLVNDLRRRQDLATSSISPPSLTPPVRREGEKIQPYEAKRSDRPSSGSDSEEDDTDTSERHALT